MEKLYFDTPKQVVFADPDAIGKWNIGIAYRDEIICACCGGIFEIADVVEMAEEAGCKQAIYPYEYWIDIAYEISDGEMPDGLSIDDIHIFET